MKISSLGDIQSKDPGEITRFQIARNKEVEFILNKGILFTDNIKCAICDVQFTAQAEDTEVYHNLGRVPIGYIVIKNTTFSNIKDGSKGWNQTSMYLQSDDGTARVRIIVLGG